MAVFDNYGNDEKYNDLKVKEDSSIWPYILTALLLFGAFFLKILNIAI